LVECATWVKDSHGLFDYETSQTSSKQFRITEPCKVIRSKQEIVLSSKDLVIDKSVEDTKGLATIAVIRDQFWVYSGSATSPEEEQLWIVLRGYIGEDGRSGYKLKEGDVIKMGRCKYLLRELVRAQEGGKSLENNMENTIMEGELLPNNAPSSVILVERKDDPPKTADPATAAEQPPPTAKKEEKQCRICLGEDNDPTNPLIESPCACIGSVKLMHINCLKHWLQSKVTEKRTDFSISYSWKQFECEVCKVKYPGILF